MPGHSLTCNLTLSCTSHFFGKSISALTAQQNKMFMIVSGTSMYSTTHLLFRMGLDWYSSHFSQGNRLIFLFRFPVKLCKGRVILYEFSQKDKQCYQTWTCKLQPDIGDGVVTQTPCQYPDFLESFRCSASQRCSHSDIVAGKKSAILGQIGPGQIWTYLPHP